jgi:hypothetical protein
MLEPPQTIKAGPIEGVRVMREAEPLPIPAPVVAQAHEGLLMAADAANLTAAGLPCG